MKKLLEISSCYSCYYFLRTRELVEYVPGTGSTYKYVHRCEKAGWIMRANHHGNIPKWCPLPDVNYFSDESVLEKEK
jgi:hypothetical protein